MQKSKGEERECELCNIQIDTKLWQPLRIMHFWPDCRLFKNIYKLKFFFFFLCKFLNIYFLPQNREPLKKAYKNNWMKTKVNITKENNLSYIHMGPTYSTYLRNKILLKKLD